MLASHQAVCSFVEILIFNLVAPSTFLVCLGMKFVEIGGCYPEDIVPYLLPSCANVRGQWKISWTRFFSFVKAAHRFLSLKFDTFTLFLQQENIKHDLFFRLNGLEKTLPNAKLLLCL